jgi:hypothetical protein
MFKARSTKRRHLFTPTVVDITPRTGTTTYKENDLYEDEIDIPVVVKKTKISKRYLPGQRLLRKLQKMRLIEEMERESLKKYEDASVKSDD